MRDNERGKRFASGRESKSPFMIRDLTSIIQKSIQLLQKTLFFLKGPW
jgi:hypothetical protein